MGERSEKVQQGFPRFLALDVSTLGLGKVDHHPPGRRPTARCQTPEAALLLSCRPPARSSQLSELSTIRVVDINRLALGVAERVKYDAH